MPGKRVTRETVLEQMQALLRESHKLAKRSADVFERMKALAVKVDAEAIRRESERKGKLSDSARSRRVS